MPSAKCQVFIRWPNRFTVSSRSWAVPITKGYIALIRRSGKESNLTQLMVIHRTTFLTALRLMERPLSLTQPCR